MKTKFCIFIITILITACQKAQIEHTTDQSRPIPWTDSSSHHPKNSAYQSLIEKYNKKGLPGISLLINDKYGTWVGSVGYADIQQKVLFRPGDGPIHCDFCSQTRDFPKPP